MAHIVHAYAVVPAHRHRYGVRRGWRSHPFLAAAYGTNAALSAEERDVYGAWINMRHRCSNPRTRTWPYYGGRGIYVCARWRFSFVAFVRDMGPRPSSSHSIDRIDTNGNYEPSNCRWATASEQGVNRHNYGRHATGACLSDYYSHCEPIAEDHATVRAYTAALLLGLEDDGDDFCAVEL